MKKIFKIIIGRLRLFWGFCPECNSDAPKLYDCRVCKYYGGSYPPDQFTKNDWWYRFKDQFIKLNVQSKTTKP
jgi:hypothetical protein